MSTVKAAFKAAFEGGLIRSGIPRAARVARGTRRLVLAYHNVVTNGLDPAGERSLHLPLRAFREQMDVLADLADVVPLEEVLTRRSGAGRRPRVAITFDDAYGGAVRHGIDELGRRGFPATIFVAPAFVGGRMFWWDRLACARTGTIPAPVRERALCSLRGENDRILDWAAETGGLGPPQAPHPDLVAATEAELSTALGRSGIALGSHSWSHANLVRLGEEELWGELVRPLRWLRDRFAAVVPWLAYPYGLESPLVRKAAAAAGYVGAVRVDGGWIPDGSLDRFLVPRLNVPAGLSSNGLALKLSGLFAR